MYFLVKQLLPKLLFYYLFINTLKNDWKPLIITNYIILLPRILKTA